MNEGTAAPVVVVADDNRMILDHVVEVLNAEGMHVYAENSAAGAVERARTCDVDAVLLDVMMPGLSGIDACRLIKAATSGRFVPVLLLTSRSDLACRIEGLRLGADDYITKPFEDDELVARVQTMIRIKRMHDNVADAKQRLAQETLRDGATNLYNSAYFQKRLKQEFKRAERHMEPLASAVADIDDFHDKTADLDRPSRDALLLAVGERLESALRESDVIARVREHEFGLILPNTSFAGALSVADRVARCVLERPFDLGDAQLQLSVSIGLGSFPGVGVRTRTQLIETCNLSVARARQCGPNRICVLQNQGMLFAPGEALPTSSADPS